MKAFITGITGFVGPHLTRHLLASGFNVTGLGLRRQESDPTFGVPSSATVINADVRDYPSLRQILKEVVPDHVYHLAAISNVAASLANPRTTYDINVIGTLNLLEALRDLDIQARVVHVSTAHIYSSVHGPPIDESSPVSAPTPYGASKLMSETLAKQYSVAYELPVIIARPFNHIGPGQSAGFVCSDFARQIAAIRLGRQDAVLRVGNLAPVRDFTDVRDVVEAYATIATRGISGEIYNITSGCAFSIGQIVDI